MTEKKQKSVNAKNSKKSNKTISDYGVSAKSIKPPKEFSKESKIPNTFFKFEKLGDILKGIYIGVKLSAKKGWSDSLIIQTADGNQVLTPLSFELNKKIVENPEIIEGKTSVWIHFIDVVEIKGKNPLKCFEVYYG